MEIGEIIARYTYGLEMNFIMVHYIGAILAFGCGLVYIWAQTLFSYWMRPEFIKATVLHCRLFLSCLSTIFFITMGIFGTIFGQHAENWFCCKQLKRTLESNPHYVEHMIATCSEWLLAICFEFYILTFAIEFRHISCHGPKLKLNLDTFYQINQFNADNADKTTGTRIESNNMSG
ncbi:hypothetical protein LOAG_08520 [Loa loa]|uniref:CWH43-like N-terminal domain-containing protein n=1 Tax=Loa loa TaxID=7209 RepID=A0A1S0TU41_LOALO|nr:hypothetical protein LOAG_08520 [Loa loa]EFO19973.1 hypothetical protein LOAG_08520 [Loa loa]